MLFMLLFIHIRLSTNVITHIKITVLKYFFVLCLVGPYLVLEYCENGPMRDWLLTQKRRVTDDVIERFYRLTLDVSKGMEYLSSKKVWHSHKITWNTSAVCPSAIY